MDILGISCYYHDAAASLIRDGQLIAASEEERFSRKKHDFDFPKHAINYCLEAGGITGKDLDYVVFFEKPFRKLDRILAEHEHGSSHFPDFVAAIGSFDPHIRLVAGESMHAGGEVA